MYKIVFGLVAICSIATAIGLYWLRPTSAVPNSIAPASSNYSIPVSSSSQAQSTSVDSLAMVSQVNKTSEKPTIAHTEPFATAASMTYNTESDEYRVLAAKRLSLENASEFQTFITDLSPLVRETTLKRLLQLEEEYELVEHIERQPSEPSKFLSAVLDTFNTEIDPFVLKSGLDYLGEYGERNPQAEQTLKQLLQRPDLPENVLEQIGELLVENHDMSPNQAKKLLLDSPSAGNIPDEDRKNFGKTIMAHADNADPVIP